MIDANQEAYYESALFLPLATAEFSELRRGRRPGIVGFREHIFSNLGCLGNLAAQSEFTFGTVIQRTMDWPLEARFHYGHPGPQLVGGHLCGLGPHASRWLDHIP